jgi:hypothetical protein
MTADQIKLAESILKETPAFKDSKIEYEVGETDIRVWSTNAFGAFIHLHVTKYFDLFHSYIYHDGSKCVLRIF